MEDIQVEVGWFIFLVDFVILNIGEAVRDTPYSR